MICNCSQCDKKLRIPDAMMGRMVMCPNCKNKFRAALPKTTETDEVAEEHVAAEPRPKRPPTMPSKKPRRPIVDDDRPAIKRSHEPAEEEVDGLQEVDELEEVGVRDQRIDEEPLRRRSGRKRNKKAWLKRGRRWADWWSGLSSFDKFLAGTLAVCLILAVLGVVFPPIVLIPVFLSAALSLLAQLMLIRAAFEEGGAVGCAFLIVPFFPLYFIIAHFEEAKKPLLLHLASFGLLIFCVCCAGVGSALWHALLPSAHIPW
jgi:hypothetical protein